MKKNVWDKILKVVIAVASAILGALGANAMNVKFVDFIYEIIGRKAVKEKHFIAFLLFSSFIIPCQPKNLITFCRSLLETIKI